ncbi:MAG: BamA/TamA family outer membrane protein [Alphaproteobacteria bacterium]|nr:BamA/TamA family outer membrane protein [Alphaproteobacteria bacterium]
MRQLIPALLAAGLVAPAAPLPAQPVPPAPPPLPADAAEPPLPGPDAPLPDLPGGAALPWPDITPQADAEPEPGAAAISYQVAVEGLDALGLDDEFRGLSSLWLHRGEDTNLAQLGRRIAEDRDLVDLLLRSIGHYGGTVRITTQPPAGNRRTSLVTVAVEPGPLYRITDLVISAPEGAVGPPDPGRIVSRLLPIRVGDPLDAARVQSAQASLPVRLADAGYPFPRIGPPSIIVDHAGRDAVLRQEVDLGRRGLFGRITVEPAARGFDSAHVTMLARFRPGDRYSEAGRDDLRRALVQTGLFGGVAVTPVAGAIADDGQQTVDLTVSTEPAPQRTIALAGGFSTGQGVRLEGSWTHRNLAPPEGAFTARAVAAEREQLAQVELRRRNFRRRDQLLLASGGFSASQQFAFAAETIGVTAALARESNIIWQKDWTWSIGAQALVTSQRDRSAPGDPRRTFTVFALPASLTWDQSDDLLNPSRGFRLTTRLSPEFTLRNQSNFNYLKAQFETTAYQPMGPLVLAGRFHIGSIIGASRGVIAPDRRFYAGGGGSVRGYVFQGVGPRNADNVPTGGNSLTELAVEARYRFQALGQDLGLVAFLDAGEVSTGTTPAFDRLSLGAGIGARVYTGFGPVRIDIATPINPQRGDPRLVFYVSIGQAF